MAFVGKTLADGQLANALAVLYTVPGSTRAVIKSIDICSLTAIAQTVQLYIRRSGGSTRRICNVNSLQLNEAIHVLEDGQSYSLAAGDTIEGFTTTAGSLDFMITGAEETP